MCTQFYGRWALPSKDGAAPSPGATWPHPRPRPPTHDLQAPGFVLGVGCPCLPLTSPPVRAEMFLGGPPLPPASLSWGPHPGQGLTSLQSLQIPPQ